MPASTSISNTRGALALAATLHFVVLNFLAVIPTAHAADGGPSASPGEKQESYRGTPYTEYGEFNEEEEEAEVTQFFQYGRFFGVSLGAGYEGATANRGLLWRGGFPYVSLKLHYWFDFNFALQMEGAFASHYYELSGVRAQVSLMQYGLSVRYAFDTRDLSAPWSFASPFIVVGGGGYNKSERSIDAFSDRDNTFGFSAGGGLEFPIKHRKVYVQIDGRVHYVLFEDRTTRNFVSRGIGDLEGLLYTTALNLLFTW